MGLYKITIKNHRYNLRFVNICYIIESMILLTYVGASAWIVLMIYTAVQEDYYYDPSTTICDHTTASHPPPAPGTLHAGN